MIGETEAESPLGAPSMSPMTAAKPCTPSPSEHSINLMVILAAIVCACLCALGLNTMLQCVFQCANRVLTQPFQWIASRRLNSGLKKTEVVALPTSTYTHSGGSPCNCAICLSEFSDGDKIRLCLNFTLSFFDQLTSIFDLFFLIKSVRIPTIGEVRASPFDVPRCHEDFTLPLDSSNSIYLVIQ
ncbi:hypothetical protein ACSQ67_020225 [Phaseolus vulgaris]